MQCRAVGLFDDGKMTGSCAYAHGHRGPCDWAALKLTDEALRAEIRRRWPDAEAPAVLLNDDQLRDEYERRKLTESPAIWTDEYMREEIARRWPNSEAGKMWLDREKSHAEQLDRVRTAHLDMVSMASRKHNELSFMTTERDEWKRRAEIEKDHCDSLAKQRDDFEDELHAVRARERLLRSVDGVMACGHHHTHLPINATECSACRSVAGDQATAESLAKVINTPPDPKRVEAVRPSFQFFGPDDPKPIRRADPYWRPLNVREANAAEPSSRACGVRELGPGIAMTPNHPLGGDGHYVDPLDLLADDA